MQRSALPARNRAAGKSVPGRNVYRYVQIRKGILLSPQNAATRFPLPAALHKPAAADIRRRYNRRALPRAETVQKRHDRIGYILVRFGVFAVEPNAHQIISAVYEKQINIFRLFLVQALSEALL